MTPVYQVFHYTSIYILRQLTLPCHRTFSNLTHSGGSNTNSFRLLATLFKTKNSIDMPILCSELSQLKRIAIINAISNCVCKFCPYRCYILKFTVTPLPIVLSDSKIDKKRVPFPSCSYKNQLIKKGTLFHLLQTNVNAHYRSLRRNFHLQKSFHKPIFGILNRLDIDKKGSQNQSITVW